MGDTTVWEDERRDGPTPGYDYQRGADGTWWARDQRTGAVHWHDAQTNRWVHYRMPSEPERPSFPYASFWERFGAWLVDGSITGVLGYGIGWLIGEAMLQPDATRGEFNSVIALAQVVGIVVGWLYYAVMESSRLQATIGKRMIGLQVTDTSGERIRFRKATGRHFAKFLSALTLGIGFLMVAWDDKKQGLHDRAAGTLILKRGLNTLRPQLPEV